MCRTCLAKQHINPAKAIAKWRICGKSHEYINGQMRQGCRTGRVCSMCHRSNGGKSYKKGKGKHKYLKNYVNDLI